MPQPRPFPAQPRAPVAGPRLSQVCGHFGELLQGRAGASGPLALITLPCPVLSARASLRPGPLALHQPGAAALDLRRLRAFLAALGLRPTGRFTLRLDMLPGGGAGASTAALVALARVAGADESRIASACLAIEGASDPLMEPAPGQLLWASRQNRILSYLPPLPRADLIGGHWGPPQRTDPRDQNFPDISDLLAAWPGACADPAQMARLASASARRTLALRGPAGDPTEALADQLGALGFAIAHTGSARALIYPQGGVPAGAKAALQAAGFTRIIRFSLGGRHA